MDNDFRDMQLKPSHHSQPLWVTPDGRIFLETYSPFYKQVRLYMPCHIRPYRPHLPLQSYHPPEENPPLVMAKAHRFLADSPFTHPTHPVTPPLALLNPPGYVHISNKQNLTHPPTLSRR